MTEAQTITEETALRLLRSTQRLEVLLTENKEREKFKIFMLGVATAEVVAILIVIVVSAFSSYGVTP